MPSLDFFFFFFFFLIQFNVPFQDFFSSYDGPISRGGGGGGRKRENPEKKHLTHPQAELGLSHMWPERDRTHTGHSGEMIEWLVKCSNEISALLTTRPRGPPH